MSKEHFAVDVNSASWKEGYASGKADMKEDIRALLDLERTYAKIECDRPMEGQYRGDDDAYIKADHLVAFLDFFIEKLDTKHSK